jgi:hypothetical protein
MWSRHNRYIAYDDVATAYFSVMSLPTASCVCVALSFLFSDSLNMETVIA